MADSQKETLVILVTKVDNMQSQMNAMYKQLNINTTKTTSIETTLASWTGGRKVLVWIIGVILTFGMIIATIIEAFKDVR